MLITKEKGRYFPVVIVKLQSIAEVICKGEQVICIKAWAYGQVQGVGFRYSTQKQAESLGLTGYANNLSDGSVEVLICGEQIQTEKLLAWLKAGGPAHARVDTVLTEPCTDQSFRALKGFTTGNGK